MNRTTNWFGQGLSEYDVMALAGHADIKTTRKYYLAVRDEDLSSASKVMRHILSEAAAN